MYRGVGRCEGLQRAVKSIVNVVRRKTTIVVIVAQCRDDSVYVLTNDLAVAQLCQYILHWRFLFGCSNGHRSANKQFS